MPRRQDTCTRVPTKASIRGSVVTDQLIGSLRGDMESSLTLKVVLPSEAQFLRLGCGVLFLDLNRSTCALAQRQKRSPTSDLWVRTGRDMTTIQTAWICFSPWSLTKQQQPRPTTREWNGNSRSIHDHWGSVGWRKRRCGYSATNATCSMTFFTAGGSPERIHKDGLLQVGPAAHTIIRNER